MPRIMPRISNNRIEDVDNDLFVLARVVNELQVNNTLVSGPTPRYAGNTQGKQDENISGMSGWLWLWV